MTRAMQEQVRAIARAENRSDATTYRTLIGLGLRVYVLLTTHQEPEQAARAVAQQIASPKQDAKQDD